MVELLSVVALIFTNRDAVYVHCPRRWREPRTLGYVQQYPSSWHVWLPRATCHDLVDGEPTRDHLDTFTHELIHVRFPRVRHGAPMRRYVWRYRAEVRELLP